MFAASLFALGLAATAFAQAPEGYSTVYLTSKVDVKYVIVPAKAEAGGALAVQVRDDSVGQQWYIKQGSSHIQLAETTLCIDAGAQSNWKDMALIHLAECDEAAPGQIWDVKEDGRIAVEASPAPQECIDLQYMRATPGNPVGLYTCAGLGGIGAADAGLNWPQVEVATEAAPMGGMAP
ncbi:uncharacterized protein DNG_09936 [Cephalotrichum gorgonifer]|uniref:Ricin B lectin domain-containing protein n=1 Tax=Cephalotrichum gorgonifer TaxID=2041049 RepID=A0AAE8N8U5_9PEZI|nr:uncharacterized protein DNG_09936 [Cephalotrichum gorgonifer]